MSFYIKEIKVKNALNKLKRKIPYGWDLNIYRGCTHRCQYCYSRYSHQYLGSNDFYHDLFVKTNIVEVLERELQSPNWQGEIINLGGVTDSYQPLENRYQLIPQILKLLIKYKNPIIISTKSDLILRDFHLIDKLSRLTYVNIATSIITTDENLVKKIEPGAAGVKKRFQILKEFRNSNASRGLHVMPIIPFLTDREENFASLFSQAEEVSVDYVLCGTLYLRGLTRPYFLSFLNKEFPELLDKFNLLYKRGGAGKEYKQMLYQMVNRLRAKYHLSNSYMKPIREKLGKSCLKKNGS